jgi:hypothetical protein
MTNLNLTEVKIRNKVWNESLNQSQKSLSEIKQIIKTGICKESHIQRSISPTFYEQLLRKYS